MSKKISIFLPSLSGGGAEGVFVQLANSFINYGYEIDIILVSAHGYYLDNVNSNIRVIDLKCKRVIYSLPKLVKYLNHETPYVLLSALNTNNIIAVIATALSKSKQRIVLSQRSVVIEPYFTIVNYVIGILMRLTYKCSDNIISVSSHTANELKNNLLISESKITVIYNPVNLNEIKIRIRDEKGAKTYLIPRKPYILSVGRMEKEKDFYTLIKAFEIMSKNSDASLVILGEGTLRKNISKLICKLGLKNRVLLPGYVENPYPWYSRAEIFVLSSLHEGCPNSLIQALACGIPVISTDCPGGPAEILENGLWGTIVPVGDTKAMADALVTVLNSPNKSDTSKRLNDFSIDKIARDYLKVLDPEYSQTGMVH